MLFLAKTSIGGKSAFSGLEGIAQLFTVALIFIFVLFLTYYTTKWIAKVQKGRMNSSNITIIETYKITPNKYIQIVKIGDSYFAIAVAKDTVTLLGELKEDELIAPQMPDTPQLDFKAILEKAKNMRMKK